MPPSKKVKTIESKDSVYDEKIKKLEDEIKLVKSRNDELQKQLKQSQFEVSSQNLAIIELDEYKIQAKKYKSDLDYINKLYEDVKKRCEKLESSEKENVIAELQTKILNQELQINDLELDVKTKSIRLSEFDGCIKSLKKDLLSKEKELDNVKSKLFDLRQVSNDLEKSEKSLADIRKKFKEKEDEVIKFEEFTANQVAEIKDKLEDAVEEAKHYRVNFELLLAALDSTEYEFEMEKSRIEMKFGRANIY